MELARFYTHDYESKYQIHIYLGYEYTLMDIENVGYAIPTERRPDKHYRIISDKYYQAAKELAMYAKSGPLPGMKNNFDANMREKRNIYYELQKDEKNQFTDTQPITSQTIPGYERNIRKPGRKHTHIPKAMAAENKSEYQKAVERVSSKSVNNTEEKHQRHIHSQNKWYVTTELLAGDTGPFYFEKFGIENHLGLKYDPDYIHFTAKIAERKEFDTWEAAETVAHKINKINPHGNTPVHVERVHDTVVVRIKEPSDLKTDMVKNEVIYFLKHGYKTNQIYLAMDFITAEPKPLIDEFQIIKNKLAFNLDNKGERKSNKYFIYDGNILKAAQPTWSGIEQYYKPGYKVYEGTPDNPKEKDITYLFEQKLQTPQTDLPSPVYVSVKVTGDMQSNKVFNEIGKYIDQGYESSQILLPKEFVTSHKQETINEFQRIKEKRFSLKNYVNNAAKIPYYHQLIIDSTNCPVENAAEIEEYMRTEIYNGGTLDWQSKAELYEAAKKACAHFKLIRNPKYKIGERQLNVSSGKVNIITGIDPKLGYKVQEEGKPETLEHYSFVDESEIDDALKRGHWKAMDENENIAQNKKLENQNIQASITGLKTLLKMSDDKDKPGIKAAIAGLKILMK